MFQGDWHTTGVWVARKCVFELEFLRPTPLCITRVIASRDMWARQEYFTGITFCGSACVNVFMCFPYICVPSVHLYHLRAVTDPWEMSSYYCTIGFGGLKYRWFAGMTREWNAVPKIMNVSMNWEFFLISRPITDWNASMIYMFILFKIV